MMVVSSANSFDRLIKILEKYQLEKDPLSIRIFRWSARLFKAVADTNGNHEKITKVVKDQLNILTTILSNPIDQTLFKNPVKERFCVWEKWMHREYRKLFTVSLLDRGRMLEAPPPHYFAQEMLNWVESLGEEFTPQREISTTQLHENELLALAKYPQFDNLRRTLYENAAQKAIERENTRASKEEWEWALFEFSANLSEMQSLSQPVNEVAEKNVLEIEQHIQQQIETIKRIQAETLAGLQVQMSWQEKVYEARIASLEERIASLDQISECKRQVEALELEYKKAVTSLENKIETESRYYAADRANLDSQLATIRRDHSSALSSVESLGNQITQIKKDLEAAQANLRVAQLNYETQQVAIEILNNAYQLTQSEVMRLRSKGKSCTIF